jgi:nucleotide-binding universal stress UspA family protein
MAKRLRAVVPAWSTRSEAWSSATASVVTAALRVVNFPGTQPVQSVADVAAEVGTDVIVVGTRGHSPVGGVLTGSMARRRLEVAPCPVLAVPPGAAAPEPSATHSIAAGSAAAL